MRVRVVMVLVMVTLSAPACRSGGEQASITRAPTARYTVSVDANEDGKSRTGMQGVVNFAKGFERYSIYYDGRLMEERIMVGRTEISRVHGDRWKKVENALSPGAQAFVALRHAVLDPTRSVAFVKSVADEVRQRGKASIRGHGTTHYVATVDLARIGAPTSRIETIEFWTDKEGTTHRMRYTPSGHDEGVLVWDFTDFGIPVDVSLPPAVTIT